MRTRESGKEKGEIEEGKEKKEIGGTRMNKGKGMNKIDANAVRSSTFTINVTQALVPMLFSFSEMRQLWPTRPQEERMLQSAKEAVKRKHFYRLLWTAQKHY